MPEGCLTLTSGVSAQPESPEPGTGMQTSYQVLPRAGLPCVNLQSPWFVLFLVAMTIEPRALHMLASALKAKLYPCPVWVLYSVVEDTS